MNRNVSETWLRCSYSVGSVAIIPHAYKEIQRLDMNWMKELPIKVVAEHKALRAR